MKSEYYIKNLTKKFSTKADSEKAAQMSRYMKDLFIFYGIQATPRREISRKFIQEEGTLPKNQLFETINKLWRLPQREYQYFGMELTAKFIQQSEISDIEIFEWMIVNKSWWDTVDFIAANLVGSYFRLYNQHTGQILKRWLDSGNMWLQRTTLIFQLKYKENTDVDLLTRHILALKNSKEFFIRKAIGWALREYSKTNPDWVREFVDKTTLSGLSSREALKRI